MVGSSYFRSFTVASSLIRSSCRFFVSAALSLAAIASERPAAAVRWHRAETATRRDRRQLSWTSQIFKLPAKREDDKTRSVKSSKEAALNEDVFDTFVRHGITLDDKNGIYIASRDYLYKVQWIGAKLSLDEADGAWKSSYPNDSGRGTGTTPIRFGVAADEPLQMEFSPVVWGWCLFPATVHQRLQQPQIAGRGQDAAHEMAGSFMGLQRARL